MPKTSSTNLLGISKVLISQSKHPYTRPLAPIVAPATTPLLPDQSIWATMPEYLAELNYKAAPATMRAVETQLRDFRQYLVGAPPTPENIVAHLRARLTQLKWTARTANMRRAVINGFFSWAVGRGYILRNPVEVVPVLAEAQVNRPVFTEAMFREFQKAAEGTYLWYLSTLSWFTGMRISDAALLRLDYVDLEAKLLRFTPYKTRRRGTWVELPLNDELFHMLEVIKSNAVEGQVYCCPEAATLYLRDRGGLIGMKFQKILAKCQGMPPGITFHCFRHSRATRMLNGENKVDVLTAKDFLGLTSVETLARYVHVPTKEKEKAMNA